MAGKNWALTDLTQDGTLTLNVGRAAYPVVHFTATWAVNEIPSAVVMLAVGRDARSSGAATAALTNAAAAALQARTAATVEFAPAGEYAPGVDWPAGNGQTIFNGFLTGTGFRKVQGKVYMTVNLTHWLVNLTYSSTLSAYSHPGNPTQLTMPAVIPDLSPGAGTTGAPLYLPQNIGYSVLSGQLETDLWAGIKNFLCALARVNKAHVSSGTPCGGITSDVSPQDNTQALEALALIEGPGSYGAPAASHHVPLALNTLGVTAVTQSVCDAITFETLDTYANMTFWDALVGRLCPTFRMAVVPLVETAVVIADTPAFRTPYKGISTSEYDSGDVSGWLAAPLRAVGVYSIYESYAGSGQSSRQPALSVGGCYDTGDKMGVTLYIPAPRWLAGVSFAGGPEASGLQQNTPVPTSTTPTATGPAAAPAPDPNINQLYQAFAHSHYVASTLRGRTGPLSGKLRFDIAPGSIVQVHRDPELFLAGVDQLAQDYYACVSRVTIAINAEARMASTSFALSHMRTAAENDDDRYSVTAHPLFGSSVFTGAPLIDAWSFPS